MDYMQISWAYVSGAIINKYRHSQIYYTMTYIMMKFKSVIISKLTQNMSW
jgi:hypothetical protein